MNATNTAAEHLEDLLGDECKCEAEHHNSTCTHKVTHLYSFCTKSLLVCDGAVRHLLESEAWICRNLTRCALCFRLGSECWSIRPV